MQAYSIELVKLKPTKSYRKACTGRLATGVIRVLVNTDLQTYMYPDVDFAVGTSQISRLQRAAPNDPE